MIIKKNDEKLNGDSFIQQHSYKKDIAQLTNSLLDNLD